MPESESLFFEYLALLNGIQQQGESHTYYTQILKQAKDKLNTAQQVLRGEHKAFFGEQLFIKNIEVKGANAIFSRHVAQVFFPKDCSQQDEFCLKNVIKDYPVIFYIPDSLYAFKLSTSNQYICQRIAAESQAVVICLDYPVPTPSSINLKEMARHIHNNFLCLVNVLGLQASQQKITCVAHGVGARLWLQQCVFLKQKNRANNFNTIFLNPLLEPGRDAVNYYSSEQNAHSLQQKMLYAIEALAGVESRDFNPGCRYPNLSESYIKQLCKSGCFQVLLTLNTNLKLERLKEYFDSSQIKRIEGGEKVDTGDFMHCQSLETMNVLIEGIIDTLKQLKPSAASAKSPEEIVQELPDDFMKSVLKI